MIVAPEQSVLIYAELRSISAPFNAKAWKELKFDLNGRVDIAGELILRMSPGMARRWIVGDKYALRIHRV